MKIVDINGRNTLIGIDEEDIINNVLLVPDTVDQIALEISGDSKGLIKRNSRINRYLSLKEIVLSARTKSIANYGLAYLSSLRKINLDNIEFIGRCAFINAIQLNSVSLDNLKLLRKSAFDGSSIHQLYFKDINNIFVVDGLKKTKLIEVMPSILTMINGKNKKTSVQIDQVNEDDYTFLAMLAKSGFKFSSSDFMAQRFYQVYEIMLKLLKSLKKCINQDEYNINFDNRVRELNELYMKIVDNNFDLIALPCLNELNLQIIDEFDSLENIIKRKYM